MQELQTLQEQRAEQVARREKLRRDVEAVPAGYDRAVHDAAEAQLRMLRDLETRAARLEETTRRRAHWERERAEATQRESTAAERTAAAAAERQALRFSEEGFAAVRDENARADARLHSAELRATELKGQLRGAEQSRAAAVQAEAEFQERLREVEAREDELRHHQELDDAFSALRTELNSQVRPELSEIASALLAQLTDGRYTALEIDDSYNVLVLDEGEEKPVISGGEEDVANLVLRLSLSQMIAERAGHPLSLLILDEVFGSLDIARRDNVVRLLRGLEDRFEQVILITHVEGIRETLDQVLRVEFDERTGSSIVRAESLIGPDTPPEVDLAAD
jgi:exonuclease SbcC